MNKFLTFLLDEDGATAIEYGLIAALISVAIIGSLQTVASSTTDMFDYVSTEVDGAL